MARHLKGEFVITSEFLANKGLSPQEEAVFHHSWGEEHDQNLIPEDEKERLRILYIALLKIGGKCPVDVTGPCEEKFEVATVVVDRIGNEKIPSHDRVSVQWFGKTNEGTDLSPLQFRFELMMRADDIRWMEHPEKFKVGFLGRIKDWPNPEARESLAQSLGSLETYIAWIWTDFYTTTQGIPSFAVPVILLGNPNVGAIFPKTYSEFDGPREASLQASHRNEEEFPQEY